MFSQRPSNKKIKINLNSILNFSRKSDCKAVDPLLWGYAASQLDNDASEKVIAHIAHCSICRQHLETYRQTVTGIAALRERQIPASLTTWYALQVKLASEAVAQPMLALTHSSNHSAMNKLIRKMLPTGFTLRSSVLLRFGSCGALAAACLLLGMMTTWHDRARKPSVESASVGLTNSGDALGQRGGNKVKQIASHLPTPHASLGSLLSDTDAAHSGYNEANETSPHLVRQNSKLKQGMNASRLVLSSSSARRHLLRNFTKDRFLKNSFLKNSFSRKSLSKSIATQTAAVTKKSRWTLDAAGMETGMETGTKTEQGQASTEFVLTSVEESRKTRPDYVMDSVDSNAQNIALQSNNKSLKIDLNKQTVKEIQGW